MIGKDDKTFITNGISTFFPNAIITFFGSRVTGTNKTYSDCDVSINNNQKLDLKTLSKLKELFSESHLPYLVDIVDYYRVSDEFKAIIDTFHPEP